MTNIEDRVRVLEAQIAQLRDVVEGLTLGMVTLRLDVRSRERLAAMVREKRGKQ